MVEKKKTRYTVYLVDVDGNEKFPRGGILRSGMASSPVEALVKAEKDDYDFDNKTKLIFYKDANCYSLPTLNDSTIIVVCKGKVSYKTMLDKVDALWS